MSTCIERAGTVEAWPNCSVIECPNKVCMWAGRGMCFPHSFGLPLAEWHQACEAGKRAECLAKYGWYEPGDGSVLRLP